MKKEELIERCINFSIKINKLRKCLREEQHEYNNSDQLQRICTSISANYCEACNAVSKADFINKLAITQKEAYETIYWLKVLYGSELIPKDKYEELVGEAEALHKILSTSITTIKENENK